MPKQSYIDSLSFSREEVTSALKMEYAGISTAVPAEYKDLDEYLKETGFSFKAPAIGDNANDKHRPKEEDYVKVPFRLLSATIVAGGTWRATDFSNEKVLKKSCAKLEGKPLYTNHDVYDVKGSIGHVQGVSWSNSFTDSSGKDIPAGINGVVCVDAVSEPKLARRVLAGDVASNSVTVVFKWEPSHEYENKYDFLEALGTIHKDGKMVRRVVTDVMEYHETSLVFLGADPYAKSIMDNGDLKCPDYSHVYSASKDAQDFNSHVKGGLKDYSVRFGVDDAVLSLNSTNYKPKQSKPNKMDEILVALRQKLNLAEDADITVADLDKLSTPELPSYGAGFADDVIDFLKTKVDDSLDKTTFDSSSLNAVKEAYDKLVSERDNAVSLSKSLSDAKISLEKDLQESRKKEASLMKEKVNMDAEIAALKEAAEKDKEFAGIGKNHVDTKRAEALRLYSLSVDNKPLESMVNMIESADHKVLEGLLNTFSKDVSSKFTYRCNECHSTDIDTQSSLSDDTDPKTVDTGSEDAYAVSYEDIVSRMRKKKSTPFTV